MIMGMIKCRKALLTEGMHCQIQGNITVNPRNTTKSDVINLYKKAY